MKKKLFKIGEVSKKLGIHDQTIRTYESKELIKPTRSANNTRFFSKENINKITIIITLTQELGMNLSGVKMVFALSKKLGMNNDELLDFIYDHKNEFQN
ncbi:MAG: MerR family transcriptional regulator [Candidatus Cloacimonetes bacterium]|jgi:MerR family transcriptional regulator, heat shock protein HspR|nr:MerR family transcriptional regulator [Candidatus Cloacimonadota bacterium]MBT6993486.1 MerR family transcriptional regulator [Candidatus Cloacimonadota bacterium]MBT7468786.1 MerR family transcriptional regulator [Candidatus Cloacimonadota bacterium]